MNFKSNLFVLGLCGALTLTSCGDDDDIVDDILDGDDRNELYVTTNANGNLSIYDLEDGTVRTLTTSATGTEGIFYDEDADELVVNSKDGMTGRVDVYSNIEAAMTGQAIASTASGTDVNLTTPRDLAVSPNGNIYVVADNGDVDGDDTTNDGRLFIFERGNNTVTLRNTITTDIAVWGIEFVGNDLFAVVDKTSDLAIYNNFAIANTTDALVTPSKRITIEGINRTHGIAVDGNTLIMTDIGSAMDDADGGFHIISDFQSKIGAVNNGGTLTVAGNQVRIAGAASLLGNPVAAEYDSVEDVVYIADAASGGGRVLAFDNASTTAGGDVAPVINNLLPGASSLFLYTDD